MLAAFLRPCCLEQSFLPRRPIWSFFLTFTVDDANSVFVRGASHDMMIVNHFLLLPWGTKIFQVTTSGIATTHMRDFLQEEAKFEKEGVR